METDRRRLGASPGMTSGLASSAFRGPGPRLSGRGTVRAGVAAQRLQAAHRAAQRRPATGRARRRDRGHHRAGPAVALDHPGGPFRRRQCGPSAQPRGAAPARIERTVDGEFAGRWEGGVPTHTGR